MRGVLLSPPREQTLASVAHPEAHRLGRDGKGDLILLVDDPFVAPLQKGDPTMGWEGDVRVALYINPRRRRWELWRLEVDGRYRMTCCTPIEAHSGPDVVANFISFLIAHDTRRNVDVLGDVDGHNDTVDKAHADATSDFHRNELAPRLAFALKRDGALDHC